MGNLNASEIKSWRNWIGTSRTPSFWGLSGLVFLLIGTVIHDWNKEPVDPEIERLLALGWQHAPELNCARTEGAFYVVEGKEKSLEAYRSPQDSTLLVSEASGWTPDSECTPIHQPTQIQEI